MRSIAYITLSTLASVAKEVVSGLASCFTAKKSSKRCTYANPEFACSATSNGPFSAPAIQDYQEYSPEDNRLPAPPPPYDSDEEYARKLYSEWQDEDAHTYDTYVALNMIPLPPLGVRSVG